MRFRNWDLRKRVVAVCSGLTLVFACLLVAAIAVKWSALAKVTIGVFAAASFLLLLASRNRRVRLTDDGFIYRTWLGNEYAFLYRDVAWYHRAEHEVWIYTRDKRLAVDTDWENGIELAERLRAFGIPYRQPDANIGVFDDSGEQAKLVLYLEQRNTGFAVMLAMALVWLTMGAALTVYSIVIGDPIMRHPALFILWLLFVLWMTASCIRQALFSLNVRVELYKGHFIYRNAFLKRKSYAYSDCQSRRLKRYPHTERRYKAYIRMRDGAKIVVDERIINEGFGASIGFNRLPKK